MGVGVGLEEGLGDLEEGSSALAHERRDWLWGESACSTCNRGMITHIIDCLNTTKYVRDEFDNMPQTEEAAAWFAAVYQAIQEIPHGRVTSYGHIATLIGYRKYLYAMTSSRDHGQLTSIRPYSRKTKVSYLIIHY